VRDALGDRHGIPRAHDRKDHGAGHPVVPADVDHPGLCGASPAGRAAAFERRGDLHAVPLEQAGDRRAHAPRSEERAIRIALLIALRL